MLTGRHNKGFSQKLGSLWPRTLNKEDGRQAGPGKRPAARGAHAAVSRILLCLISSALEPRGVHGHPSAWCYKELLMAYFRGRPRLESGEVQGPGLSHRHAGQAGGHSAKKGRCWGHQRAVPSAKPWGWEVVIRQQDNWQVLAPAWAGRCRPPRPFAPHAGVTQMLSPARVRRSHETIGAIHAAHTRGQAGTPVTVRSSPEPHTEGTVLPMGDDDPGLESRPQPARGG